MFKDISDGALKTTFNIILCFWLIIGIGISVFNLPEMWFGFPLSVSVIFILSLFIANLYLVSELHYLNRTSRLITTKNTRTGYMIDKTVSIPKNFCLTEKMINYAKTQGITKKRTLEDFTERFILAHKLEGSKYLDWYVVWQFCLWLDLEKGEIKKDSGQTVATSAGNSYAS